MKKNRWGVYLFAAMMILQFPINILFGNSDLLSIATSSFIRFAIIAAILFISNNGKSAWKVLFENRKGKDDNPSFSTIPNTQISSVPSDVEIISKHNEGGQPAIYANKYGNLKLKRWFVPIIAAILTAAFFFAYYSASTQFKLGKKHFRQTRYEQAAKCYTRAAMRGLSDAQRELGQCYFDGTGVEEDDSKAIKWFARAAEQGDTLSELTLATYYQYNLENTSEAINWYMMAASNNCHTAKCALGDILYLEQFKGVGFDPLFLEAGSNAFTLSPTKWIEQTNAIGIVCTTGRNGGTYAQRDIAFKFAI